MTSEQRPPVNNGHYFLSPKGDRCTQVWLYHLFFLFNLLPFQEVACENCVKLWYFKQMIKLPWFMN